MRRQDALWLGAVCLCEMATMLVFLNYTAVLPDDYPKNVDPQMRAAYAAWKRSHSNVRESHHEATNV